MKKTVLLFLMVGFLCPASVKSQGDSLQILKKLNQLEQVNKETKVLLKKSDQLEKRKQGLMERLRDYIFSLKRENKQKSTQLLTRQYKDNEGVKVENINEPIQEINLPDGVDSVRGNFLYRLLHKNAYILKPYKIVNDEKIYLD